MRGGRSYGWQVSSPFLRLAFQTCQPCAERYEQRADGTRATAAATKAQVAALAVGLRRGAWRSLRDRRTHRLRRCEAGACCGCGFASADTS